MLLVLWVRRYSPCIHACWMWNCLIKPSSTLSILVDQCRAAFLSLLAKARQCCMGYMAGAWSLVSGPFWPNSWYSFLKNIRAASISAVCHCHYSSTDGWGERSGLFLNTWAVGGGAGGRSTPSSALKEQGQSLHLGFSPLVTMSLICIVEKLTCRWGLAYLIRELSCAPAPVRCAMRA